MLKVYFAFRSEIWGRNMVRGREALDTFDYSE